jgi:hypothetical protein
MSVILFDSTTTAAYAEKLKISGAQKHEKICFISKIHILLKNTENIIFSSSTLNHIF